MQEAENKSEVARLMRSIELAYEAAQRGLNGLASGTVKHEFITAKMERMGVLHQELASLVGTDQASALLLEVWEKGEIA
jgi:hypothetical protein